jgi:hypothetical protein
MFEVIGKRPAIDTQATTDGMACVQLLLSRHRLAAARAQVTRLELGKEGSTDALVLGTVATLLPPATLGVTCTGALPCTRLAPRARASGEPATAEAWTLGHGGCLALGYDERPDRVRPERRGLGRMIHPCGQCDSA